MRDTFSADPTVVFLTSVLDDIAHGRIRIPRFQRPMVWSWVQRKEFLESIYSGLPIGALMIWATSNDQISCYESLGPHPLPQPKSAFEARYLMDGVQRISTVYGALRATQNWSEYDETKDEKLQDFVVYADLDALDEADRFKRAVDIDKTADPKRYLPLNIILQSKEFLRFQRDQKKSDDSRVDMADEVASAFRQYKVPLITLNSASLEVVTKSFERVNSRGADMNELHMLNALSYSQDFDLIKRDHEFRTGLLAPYGWQDVGSDIVLRSLKLCLGADIYKTKPDEVSKRLKDDPGMLQRTFKALKETAAFFRVHFGIANPAIVPYRLQIVAIAAALLDKNYDKYKAQLADWVWLSTYSELFGVSGRQSDTAIADLRNYISRGRFEWSLREQPAIRSIAQMRSDFRAARVKGLMLAFAFNADSEKRGLGSDLIAKFGGESFHFISLPGIDRGDAGVRFLIDPGEAQTLKAKLLSGKIDVSLKERHLISDKAEEMLLSQKYKAFTKQRLSDVFQFEMDSIIRPVTKRMMISSLRILDDTDREVQRRESDL